MVLKTYYIQCDKCDYRVVTTHWKPGARQQPLVEVPEIKVMIEHEKTKHGGTGTHFEWNVMVEDVT